EIEELVRDRQLNQHVLARWRKRLRSSRDSGEPVFRLWHLAAAIPDKEFAAKWPGVQYAAKGNPVIERKVDAVSIATLRDLAAVYAAALAEYDRAEPLREPAAEQLRAIMRGAESPVDVPLEEFELIFTEGDSNNTRSLRVRYNTMLAQAAYDGAPPRAMAVEDLPHPVPAHVFVRGNPANPGAPAL